LLQRVERPFPRRTPPRRGRLVVVIAVLLFVVSISTLVRLYTDLLWYREVGFGSVFWTILGSKFALGAAFGLGFFLFTFANLLVVTRLMPVYRTALDPDDPLERYRGAFVPYIRWIALGLSGFLALLFGITVTPSWEKVILALNKVPFRIEDAVFHRDISFYVFRLPFYEFLYNWLFSGLIVVILIVAAAHYLTGGIRPQSPGDRVTPQVKAHLSALVGLLVLLRAWGYRLNQFNLLYSQRGEVTGASYTDLHAELQALVLLMFISVIVALLFLVNIRRRGWALPIAGVGLWLVISILGRGLFPFIVERFTVAPSPLQKEKPYIERNIKGTRAAYGLDAIQVKDHLAEPGINAENVSSNAGTVENIRLWDPETLFKSFRQLQEIRTYYQFEDVDIDRYVIGGRTRQLMLSARELAPENVPTKSWLNLHVVYTHGYGAVVSPTNQSSPEGEPDLLVENIPPKTEVPELELPKPAVYFGEGLKAIEYSLVRTKQQELDYGTPERTVKTTYQGKGGVQAGGALRRLAFAWRFRNVNLAISDLIKGDTRILYYRNVKDRLQMAAPFMRFDGDPYPVIAGGRMVWLADGYTLTSMYPYSERREFGLRTARRLVDESTLEPSIDGTFNYIRNSVKATVDANDGTVTLYVWDDKDPIIRAWRKAFPKLFKDRADMPANLQSHVRYPEDLFRIQSDIYLRYHMTDTTDFFTKEDQWQIPADPSNPNVANDEKAASVLEELQPYYVLMRPPGSNRLEYLLILPVNPSGKRNMVAYLAAKSDPEEYGQLVDFRFPRGRQIDGVGQVSARINQQPAISSRRTLLSQQGSRVRDGNLLVIPMGESILYVQPWFLQASRSPIPELIHVILATQDKVVLGSSLEDAFKLLLEGGPVTVAPITPGQGPTTPTTDQAIQDALQHFAAADQALKNGDLETYAREIRAARQSLESAQAPAASPSP
jgi:uncharacterized membrane protein (UPF0182 family)